MDEFTKLALNLTYNIVVIALWIMAAKYFNHWGIALFSIIFYRPAITRTYRNTNVPTTNEKEKTE